MREIIRMCACVLIYVVCISRVTRLTFVLQFISKKQRIYFMFSMQFFANYFQEWMSQYTCVSPKKKRTRTRMDLQTSVNKNDNHNEQTRRATAYKYSLISSLQFVATRMSLNKLYRRSISKSYINCGWEMLIKVSFPSNAFRSRI